ncbi:chorismate mutase [archaeon]|jgi:chorismate mutase|nr:chorismate mutase [archaeon]MBT6761525.1 chorismate mutase [archaeon]
MNNKEKVQQMRTELQVIDRKLLSLIEKRVKKSIKIQDLKQRTNLPLVDLNQERATINFVKENSSLISAEIVTHFTSVIDLSKKEFHLQNKKFKKEKLDGKDNSLSK